jgi:hypothetical protein
MGAVTDLLHRQPVLQSLTADLRRSTWTFSTPAQLSVRAGEFALVPIPELRDAEAADSARVCVQLQASTAPRTMRFSCGGGYRSYIVDAEDDSFSVSMQNEIIPDDVRRRGVWYGSMDMQDAWGRRWTHQLGYMVVDDFGCLVGVDR